MFSFSHLAGDLEINWHENHQSLPGCFPLGQFLPANASNNSNLKTTLVVSHITRRVVKMGQIEDALMLEYQK